MEVFKSKGPRKLYLPRLRERIHFDANGEYATDDPKIIQALRNHRYVIQSKESEAPIQSKDEPREPVNTPPVLTDDEREKMEAEAEDGTKQEATDHIAETAESDNDDDGEESEVTDNDDDDDLVQQDEVSHTQPRPELDDIAKELGLNPKKYGNKRALATAINDARGLNS